MIHVSAPWRASLSEEGRERETEKYAVRGASTLIRTDHRTKQSYSSVFLLNYGLILIQNKKESEKKKKQTEKKKSTLNEKFWPYSNPLLYFLDFTVFMGRCDEIHAP